MRRVFLVLLLLVPAGSCSRGVRTHCERVCRAEADCADTLDLVDTDFTECVESCHELERDPHTQKLVEAHVQCVVMAPTCDQLMECP